MNLDHVKQRIAQFEQALEQAKAHYHTILGRLTEAKAIADMVAKADPSLQPVASVIDGIEAVAETVDHEVPK